MLVSIGEKHARRTAFFQDYLWISPKYFDVAEEADTAVILERKTPVSFAEVALCVQRHQFDNR